MAPSRVLLARSIVSYTKSGDGTPGDSEDEELEDEDEPLQNPPRTRHMEEYGDGSGPEKDSVTITRSAVVEPRPVERTNKEKPKTIERVPPELEKERAVQPGPMHHH